MRKKSKVESGNNSKLSKCNNNGYIDIDVEEEEF